MNLIPLKVALLLIILSACAELPPHNGSLSSVYAVNNETTIPSDNSLVTPKQSPTIVETQEEQPLIQTVASSSSLGISPYKEQSEVVKEIPTTITVPINNSLREDPDVLHTVHSGETLYNIAEKHTGSSDNWEQIANFNNMSSPDALMVGEIIKIPSSLVINGQNEILEPVTYEVIITREEPPEVLPQPVEKVVEKRRDNKVSSVLPVAVALPQKDDGISVAAPISKKIIKEPVNLASRAVDFAKRIKEKITNADVFKTKQSKIETVNNNTVALTNEPSRASKEVSSNINHTFTAKNIIISGSFTPKAIYKGAGYESGLLMRVPPGTRLKLTKLTDSWYEVETTKGSGYVFHRDAELIQ